MKPFLQGRKTLSIESLRLPPGLVPSRATVSPCSKAGASPEATSNAKVEVIKEGDRVVRLEITCACGERIEIDCLYPVGS